MNKGNKGKKHNGRKARKVRQSLKSYHQAREERAFKFGGPPVDERWKPLEAIRQQLVNRSAEQARQRHGMNGA